MKGRGIGKLLFTGCILILTVFLPGCSSSKNNSVTEIEIVQYKPEAANYFKMVEKAFNETHDNIHLTINSPNDAAAILRTRFIREDYPDIVGIGGDIEYSYYVDAQILADVSNYKGLSDITGILMNPWNWCQQMEHLLSHIWQMQQVSCITRTYLNRMDGKYQLTGMNL